MKTQGAYENVRANRSLPASIALLLATAAWGLTFPLIKGAIQAIPPFTFVGVRFLLASVFLAFAVRRAPRDSVQATGLSELKAGIFLGTLLFLGCGLQTLGLQSTTASNAGFITGICVALVPVIAWLVDRTTINRASVIGILMSLVGIGLLSLSGGLGLNRGDGIVLLCAIAFAAYIVFVGKFADRFNSVRLTWLQITTCAVWALPCAVIFEKPSWSQLQLQLSHSHVWVALAFCAFIATSGAFLVQNIAQKYVTPVQAALIFSLEPVFSVLFGYWMMGEILTSQQQIGCALMLAGMIFGEVGEGLLAWGRGRGRKVNWARGRA